METQNKALRSHLLKGKTITQPEAMQTMLIGRLAARINDLINDGLAIESRFVPYERADGKVVQIKKYWYNNYKNLA